MNRGDVVEIVWHYTDQTGSKRRPALVIQADFLNGILDDTILVQITGSNHGLGTEVPLDPAVETNSGLIKPSVANCTNIATVEQIDVLRTIGFLTPAAIKRIEAALKTTLAIP